MRLRAAAVSLIAVLASVPAGGNAHAQTKPGDFFVGTARASIAPTFPYKDGTIYVGGVIPGPLRPADGNAAPTYARAVAISGRGRGSGVVLVELDIQGAFAALKQGAYGLDDVQRSVAPKLGLKPSQIIIGSSHTHAGADIMGLWGGSPVSYMSLVARATGEAITRAWANRRPAHLSWASVKAPTDLLQNQSNWQDMDYELRVLVATDARTGRRTATLPNWQGHPSVVPGNELHPDWPGVLDDLLERRHPGSFAMSFVGAVGHTQTGQQGNTDEAVGIQRTTAYARKLFALVESAYARLPHNVGAGPVKTAQVFFTETVTNPNAMVLEYGNLDGVSDLYRSDQPPWLDVNVVGTRAWAVQIGDLVVGAVPGEAYLPIHTWLKDFVRRELFFMGLAGDTLGYLAAPSEDIPKFATDINDNLVVHVSTTVGDHTGCALITAARALKLGRGKAPDRCAQWTDEAVVAGS